MKITKVSKFTRLTNGVTNILVNLLCFLVILSQES